jgi:hypothetical protein
MSQKPKKTVLLVDYENVQNIDLSVIQDQDIDIKIFVGQVQSKIPIELVQATQQLGKRVEWIKMEGSGTNALDFHIAFYLGVFSRRLKAASFLVLSKDKGFDPLVKHLNKSKINCWRIESLPSISKEKTKAKETVIVQDTDSMTRVMDVLSKMANNSRPKTRKSLHQHVKSVLQKKLSDQAIETLVETLFVQKKVTEVNDRLTYNF